MINNYRLWKIEPFIFWILVLINTIPILGNAYFPTVDGPAHLYNANLLKQFWIFNQQSVTEFFQINSNFNSNWFTHIFYILFGSIFSASVTDKLLLISFVIGFSFGFRLLVIRINNHHSGRIASYLIFPFIYSFTLCIGFFNFCIGIALMFLFANYWFKIRSKLNFKGILMIAAFSVLLFYAHVFDFLVLMLFVFIYEFIQLIKNKFKSTHRKPILFLMLALMPSLVLSALFVLKNNQIEKQNYLTTTLLNEWLLHINPIITYSYDNEKLFSGLTFISVAVLFGISIYIFVKSILKSELKSDFAIPIFVLVVLFFMAYYMLPDNMFSGGFLSMRLAFFIFLFVILFCATIIRDIRLLIVPVFFCVVSDLLFVKYHYEQTSNLSNDAELYAGLQDHMEPGSVLLPLNYSDNWMHSNFSNYAGVEKLIFVLDNYEAGKPHFPLKWKINQDPLTTLGGIGNLNPCINIEAYEKASGHRVDFISKWHFTTNFNDSCSKATDSIIHKYFEKVYNSEYDQLILYKRK